MEQDEGRLTIAEASKTTQAGLDRRPEDRWPAHRRRPGPDIELDEILRLLERQTELRELAEQRVVEERGRSDERLAEVTLLDERVRELERQAGQRWYKRR